MGLIVRPVKQHHLGEPDIFKHVVQCDHCKRDIEDLNLGNALWLVPPAGVEYGEAVKIRTVHKTCTHTFELANAGTWYSDGLARYLVGALDNGGVDVTKERRKAKVLRRIGL